MKKRLLLSLLALTFACTLQQPAAQAAFDPGMGTKWGWITSTDTVTVYFDRDSVVYDSTIPYAPQDIATFCLCTVEPAANTYTKSIMRIVTADNTVQHFSSIVYDSATDQVIRMIEPIQPEAPKPIEPGSIEDMYCQIIFPR